MVITLVLEENCLHCSQMLALAASAVPHHYIPLPPCLPYWISQILSLPVVDKKHESLLTMGVTVIGGVQVGYSPENINKQDWSKGGSQNSAKNTPLTLLQLVN